MPTNIPRPLPKPGEPGYRDPNKPLPVSPPPPPKKYDVTRSQVVSLSENQNRLARSDERKRMLLERVLKAVDGVEARCKYGPLLEEIEAELSKS